MLSFYFQPYASPFFTHSTPKSQNFPETPSCTPVSENLGPREYKLLFYTHAHDKIWKGGYGYIYSQSSSSLSSSIFFVVVGAVAIFSLFSSFGEVAALLVVPETMS